MAAADVLERLAALGVNVRVSERGTLLLEPGSRVPAPLVEEFRSCKADLVALLSRPEPERITPQESQDRLLARLRAGHLWLIECTRRLQAEKHLYDGMADELTRLLDTFEALEKLLREAYSYQDCVMGAGLHCPTASPVWCRTCTPAGSRG